MKQRCIHQMTLRKQKQNRGSNSSPMLLALLVWSLTWNESWAFVLSTTSLAQRKAHRPQKPQPEMSFGSEILDPLVVCGPSGVGKGTIIQRFLQNQDDKFAFGVSHTTRSPRAGEVHGQDYFFVTKTHMERLVKEDHFVEWANVHSNIYGTSWTSVRAVQATGKRCLLDIDVQGVQRFKALAEERSQLNPRFVFIAPPSIGALETRLRGRGSESAESLQRRVGNAAAEVEYGLTEGNFDRIIVNDDLDQAVMDFSAAIESLYADS